MVTLRERYLAATQRADATCRETAEALPQLLTVACVEVLPIAAAGLSLISDLRVPLSASSPAAADAERLEMTLGSGPCLTAAAQSRPLVARHDQLDQWPVYASELRRRTPFRSVASLPLTGQDGAAFAALDLYSSDPSASFGRLADLMTEVVEPMMTQLEPWSDTFESSLEEITPTRRRLGVSVAVGMIIGSGANHADALDLLRGYAFSHDLDLDTVAELMVTRAVSIDEVFDRAIGD